MYGYDHRDYAAEQKRNWEMIAESAKEEGLGDLPTHRIVCPECNGNGKYVNPAIDSQGLAADDLDEDQWHMYRTGGYDITCGYCNGRNVVDEYDERQASLELRKYVDDYWNAVYDDRYTQIAERNAGC
jgi:hypothetical protein